MSSETQTILEEQSDFNEEAPSSLDSGWSSFIPIVFIFAIFYFLIFRPQEKKRKEHDSLVKSLKKGEDIVTSGGIHGKVVKVNESDPFIYVEIADNVEIKVDRSAIFDVTTRKESKKENIGKQKDTSNSKKKTKSSNT